MELEEARAIAERIAGGHAYEKHVLRRNEFQQRVSRSTFATWIFSALFEATETKQLARNRTAFWNEELKLLVIYDISRKDFGTAFIPVDERNVLNRLS